MSNVRSSSKLWRVLALAFSFLLLAAACSGGDDSGGEEESSGSSSQNADDEDEDEESDEDADEEEDESTTTTTTEAEEEDRDEAVGDFGDEVKDEVDEMTETETTYGEYVTVQDDSGYITIDVPAAWSDVNGAEGLFGPDVIASTDVQTWIETYDVSGLEFQATSVETNQTPDEVLDAVSRGQSSDCTPGERDVYTDPIYTGVFQVFEACGGTDTGFIWLAFEPFDGSFHCVLGVQLVTEADVEALETALTSFVLGA